MAQQLDQALTSKWLTYRDRGPKARSCHKICLDAQGNSLLVFGRYIDQFSPKIKSALPDLYRYWIDEDRWEKVSENTLVTYTVWLINLWT